MISYLTMNHGLRSWWMKKILVNEGVQFSARYISPFLCIVSIVFLSLKILEKVNPNINLFQIVSIPLNI